MPLDARAVDQMVAAQHHRGPSGTGRRVLGRAVIGHARLAIIDLSDAGTQPMTNEDGSVWITYNGELYNTVELRQELVSHGHVFRSHSDTEVLVHGYEQWGTDALLERVRGMFAFGIYDERCGLTLVRDRLGIKPLYVSASRDGAVVFASEVKALLASGLVSSEPDITALTGFLLAGSVAAPRTYVKAVSSLLPGEYFQVLISGQSQRRRYWELPFSALVREARSSQNETSGVSHATVRHLLNDSVARHLVSEVPIGVFLSGGIDSGAVVACAHRVRKGQTPLTTLTVTFDEHEFNEAEPTRAIARRFGTDHREVHVTKDAFMRALPAIQKEHKTVHTVIVGGDEVSYGRKPDPDKDGAKNWREKMLQEVGSQLDPARTHFLGKVPYSAYKRVLQVSAAHVYLTYPFVLSWSMLEAMATGCLVIGSDTAPVREVLEDGVNGRLVNALDPDHVARRVSDALASSHESAAPLRHHAARTAHSGYSTSTGLSAFAQICLGERPPLKVRHVA